MTPASRRRWLVAVPAALAAAVVLYALFGYFVAPGIVRDQVVTRLGAELARPVRVERVEIRPFALAVTLHGLAVDQPDGRPLLAVASIEADLSSASLWRRAPVVDRLRVVQPSLAFARVAPQRYDVSDLLDRWLAPSTDPTPRFSLNNVEVTDGSIAFDDRPAQRQHRVEALALGVPFVSSLPHAVAIDVQPRLAARVNGTPLALTGHALPYAERREATLNVDIDGLPLPEYAGYVPATLRFRLADGRLTTRLVVTFAQAPGAAAEVSVTGTAALAALDVRRRDGAALLAWREARVEIERLDVGQRTLRIASVAVDAPVATVRRLADGALELAGPWVEGAANAPAAPTAPAEPGWRIEIAKASVNDARATVEDTSIDPPYRAALGALQVTATTLANTAERSGRVTAALRIDDEAQATLEAEVALAPFAARGRFTVANARLARLYPYAAQALDLEVQAGSADLAAEFDVAPDGAVRLQRGKGSVRALALAAPGEREPLWRMPELGMDGLDVDVKARRVQVASLVASRPQVRLARDARGTWNAERLLRTTARTGAAPGGAAAAADDTWQLVVAKTVVQQGDVRLDDATHKPPLALRVDEIALTATQLGNARDARGTLDLRARVERNGRIALKGPLGTNPLAAGLDIEAERLPLVAAKGLVEQHANLLLAGGTLGARGRLDAQPGADGALAVAWNGDVTLRDVEALDPPTGGRLFAWRTLALSKLQARSSPREASVAALALSDFYARLIVYADGGINLAQLGKNAPAAASAPAPSGGRAARARAGAVASAAQTAERTLRRAVDGALPLAVGKITLANGNVNFSDFFVRPNYSANLTRVNGTISALSATTAGEVAIKAKLDDAAPVTVTGRIQPFARELTLSLAGRARDIALPPLTPYAVKYAGYGITRGTMSFDVNYTIENRKLDAKNRLVLDQLTFGERVESPTATKLPVLLAVALLKDANGVIELDLPVSGTLDDPQFSVFGLIVRVLGNVIGKAATAPFALLGAAVGGGDDLAYVEFGAGSAAPGAAGDARLDRLAKALASRPGLKVDVSGRADPASDGAALAAAALEASLRATKSKALAAPGGAAAPPVALAPEERPKWLAIAHAELPPEARAQGAEPTPAAMEAALLARQRPDDAALSALGLARAQAAKDALLARGVAPERVAIGPPAAGAPAAKGGARRADFALR